MTAASGREAIHEATSSRFDIVISDVRMPDLGGVDLLRELFEHDPDLPVLLVSGSPDLETATKAAQYGAFEYLVKPVAFDELRNSTRRAIELRRQRSSADERLEEQGS